MIHIDYEKCVSCGLCRDGCLSGAIRFMDGKPMIGDECILCGACVTSCPTEAVFMEKEMLSKETDLSSYSGVWVVMENSEKTGDPKRVSYELLSEARRLGDQLKEQVWAVDLCEKISEATQQELRSIGVDCLLLLEDQAFSEYNTELFTDLVSDQIIRHRPSIVLFPGTENGRDLAPRISARLRVGLTADCTGLEINDKKELVRVRPTYGGNVIASIVTPDHRPQMASVRPNVFGIKKNTSTNVMRVLRVDMDLDLQSLRVTRINRTERDNVYGDVEEASFVLIGGYGAGQEGFKTLFELAEQIGAAVGATRKAVDEGWAPVELQIGQTGKTIAPEVCICFGVSGSLQHTIGMKRAKHIISVNHDPTAPIFAMGKP